MKTMEVDVKYAEKANRFEPIISIFYSIPLAIVACLLCIPGMVCAILQAFHILILAKRNRTLYLWTRKAFYYNAKLEAYSCLLTDERPPIMPED